MRPQKSLLAICATLAMAGLGLADAASAQSLNQWGMWGERGRTPYKYKKPERGPGRIDRFEERYGSPFDPYGDPWWDEPERPRGPSVASGGARPFIAPMEPETVAYDAAEAAGTIVIDTSARRLYFTLGGGQAYAYPISVGREGFEWSGTEAVSRIAEWPDWHPPKEMRARDPKLPEKMTGGLRNPLGAVALYLGNTLYRIHGTNDRKSIGQAASSGCFRMLNEHAVHLASIAGVGTPVKVLPHLSEPPMVSDAPADRPETAPSEAPADGPRDFGRAPPVDDFEPADPSDPGDLTEAPPEPLPERDDPGIERLEILYRP